MGATAGAVLFAVGKHLRNVPVHGGGGVGVWRSLELARGHPLMIAVSGAAAGRQHRQSWADEALVLAKEGKLRRVCGHGVLINSKRQSTTSAAAAVEAAAERSPSGSVLLWRSWVATVFAAFDKTDQCACDALAVGQLGTSNHDR
jgi:hypothetical protein